MSSNFTESWIYVAQNYTQFYATFIAIFLNFLLVYLILFHSSKELGVYKYLMIYISTFEIIYTLLDVIVSPIAHSYGCTFLVMVDLNKNTINPHILSVLLSAYCGFYGTSMAIFGIHFIYRYFVASGSNLLKTFRSWMLSIWFSIPIIIGVLWTILTYWPCMRREATDKYLEANVLEKFDLRMDEIEYIAPYFYELDENGTERIFWPSFIGIGINSCIINISIFTTIFFGYKCYRCLKKLVANSIVSYRNRELQQQLFIALVTETLIPMILMHIPVSIIYFCSFASLDIGSISGIAPLGIALYPALDPLPTLFVITNYRRAVFNGVMWLPRKLFNRARQQQPRNQESTTA